MNLHDQFIKDPCFLNFKKIYWKSEISDGLFQKGTVKKTLKKSML